MSWDVWNSATWQWLANAKLLSLTNTRVRRAWPACHCHSFLLHFRPASPGIQVTKSVGSIRRKQLWLMIWHPKVERACLHWFFAFHNLSVFIRTHSASAWGPSSCSMSVMLAVYCRCASRSKRGETSETSPMLKCKCLAKMVILQKWRELVQLLGN